MTLNVIAEVDGKQIYAYEDVVTMVAIRPICSALGINYSTQYEKIKQHDFLKKECDLCSGVSKNGKVYRMFCLPEYFILGWLININPKRVKEQAKESILRNQQECFTKLVTYFMSKRGDAKVKKESEKL